MVAAVVLRPRIRHVVLAAALPQVLALLPDVAMMISVPIPVARGIDVPGSYGYVFDHSLRWREYASNEPANPAASKVVNLRMTSLHLSHGTSCCRMHKVPTIGRW